MNAHDFSTMRGAWLAPALALFLAAPAWSQQSPAQAPAPSAGPGLPCANLSNGAPTFLAHVAVDHVDGVYREGETLSVQFAAERESRLYLLYHQADGRCVLLFPNPARSDNLVLGRQIVRVPNPDEPFRFRVGPPFGVEVLQVVAAGRPVAELDALAAGGQGRGSGSVD